MKVPSWVNIVLLLIAIYVGLTTLSTVTAMICGGVVGWSLPNLIAEYRRRHGYTDGSPTPKYVDDREWYEKEYD